MIGDRRPVSRPRVFAAAAVLLALLALLIAGIELLRHPLPEGSDPRIGLSDEGGDPRIEVECGEELPREGQSRETATAESTERLQQRGDVTPVEVTSNQLYDCPQTYDGQVVRYRGEVIGAVLHRDDGAWVHLNDDIYADVLGPLPAHRDYRGGNAGVGVFVSHEVADAIEWVGGPDTRGDVLQIRGVFRRVDPASAEVAVIRAETAQIADRGGRFDQDPLRDRRFAALAAAAVAVAVTVVERVARRRQ